MTRILAFADTQLGVATVDLADQRAVLDKIVEVALEREVDVVIHGGDVFEGPVVMPEHLRCFIDAVRPLREEEIPLLVLRGNGRHDMATRDVHALDVLRELEGVHICDRPAVVTLPNIRIATIPWVHPGRLIASMNGAVDHDAVNAQAARLLVQIAKSLQEEAMLLTVADFRDNPIVLVAHWAISGSKLPTGLGVEEMREPILPWAELDALGYDAIIGAHIHQPQQISQPLIDKTLGIVCGSPQQLNFGETGDHGCWIIEIPSVEGVDERSSAASSTDAPGAGSRLAPAPSAEFIIIPSPRFVTLDLTNELVKREPTADVQLAKIGDGDIVRARYTATEDEAREFSHEKLRVILAHAGASRVQIEPKIIKQSRARVEKITEQITEVEALAEWCEANDVGPEMQHRMVGRLQEWA